MPTDTQTWTLNVTLPGEEPATLTHVPHSELRSILEDLVHGTFPRQLAEREHAHDTEHALAA